MRFTYAPKLNRALTFIFLTYIFIRKSLVISFSSCCWRLLIFTPFYIDVHKIFSSMSKLLSTWFLEFMDMLIFFFISFFWFFNMSFGCNFQNFSHAWQSTHISCSGCFDLFTGVISLLSSCSSPLYTSSFVLWKLLGILSSLNHSTTLSLGICFPSIALVHKTHPSFLVWTISLYFIDGYVDRPYTLGVCLASWERCPMLFHSFYILLCTLLLSLLKVMLSDPLVLYIPNRVKSTP